MLGSLSGGGMSPTTNPKQEGKITGTAKHGCGEGAGAL